MQVTPFILFIHFNWRNIFFIPFVTEKPLSGLANKVCMYVCNCHKKELIPDPLHQYPHPGWNMLSHEPGPVPTELTPPQQDEHSGKILDERLWNDTRMYCDLRETWYHRETFSLSSRSFLKASIPTHTKSLYNRAGNISHISDMTSSNITNVRLKYHVKICRGMWSN